MFGISGPEFLVLIVVAVVFLGPKHAAEAVAAIRKSIGVIRNYSAQLREHMAANRTKVALEDLGISAEDLAALRELRASTGSLDPRAYVRKAVSEEMDAWLGMAPVPVRQASNVPHAGKGVSFAEARKQAEARKRAQGAGASQGVDPRAEAKVSNAAGPAVVASSSPGADAGENMGAVTVESSSETAPAASASPAPTTSGKEEA